MVKIKRMTVQRGKELDYLGMNFNFQEKGKVKITMYEHVKKILKEFPDPLRNKSLSSPNTPKLFEVRKDAVPLG